VNGPIAIDSLASPKLTTLIVDNHDKLWVGKGDFTTPAMIILDPGDDSVDEALIATELTSLKVVFCGIS
jgi:hypothetical protein